MSGTDLSAAYAPSGGVTGVFSTKVEDYVRARPSYPAALSDTLQAEAGLDAQSSSPTLAPARASSRAD